MTLLWVALGAAVGAPLRYAVAHLLDRRVPWGTVLVNVVGSFVLGLLSGSSLTGAAQALLGVGFCGALTTYSTFGYETLRLARTGAPVAALLNVGLSVLAGLGAADLGLLLATLL